MPDWLDEMLTELPSEGPSPDLVHRIQTNIAIHRRRRERLRAFLQAFNGVIALIGFLLLIPDFGRLMELFPSITSSQIEGWIDLVLDSPGEASLELLSAVEMWVEYLLINLETVLILALILLAISALLGLRDFLGKEQPKGAFV